MAENSTVPAPKVRLILSIILVLVGFTVLYMVDPFDGQQPIGWIVVVVGAISIVYNVDCMRKGKFM